MLLEHYQGGTTGTLLARPEGADDLVLASGEELAAAYEYVQIKKPRETTDSQLTHTTWSVADVVRDLLPGTMARLHGNSHRQTWILGDAVDAEIMRLLEAGSSAPSVLTTGYLTVLHLLARNQVNVPARARPSDSTRVRARAKSLLERWRAPGSEALEPEMALSEMVDQFIALALTESVSAADCDDYRRAIFSAHAKLPSVIVSTPVAKGASVVKPSHFGAASASCGGILDFGTSRITTCDWRNCYGYELNDTT